MPCCKMTIHDNRPCDKKVLECVCIPSKGRSCICVCKDENNKIVVCNDCQCTNLPCKCKETEASGKSDEACLVKSESKEGTDPKCDKDGCECIQTDGKGCVCVYIDSKGNIAKCRDCDSSDTCDQYCSCEEQTDKCDSGPCC